MRNAKTPNGLPEASRIGTIRNAIGTDAKRYRLTEPQHVIHSAKRFIGQNIRAPLVQLAMTGVRYKVVEGPNQQPIVVLRDRKMTMPEISSHVLLHLKRCAERQLGSRERLELAVDHALWVGGIVGVGAGEVSH